MEFISMPKEELIKEARKIGYIIAGEYVGHLEASGKDFGILGADSISNCFKIMSIVDEIEIPFNEENKVDIESLREIIFIKIKEKRFNS